LTNSKDCSESRINLFSGFSSLSLVDFSNVHSCPAFGTISGSHAAFRTFRVTGSQAAIGKPEQTSEEGFSQLVSDFIKASWNFIMNFIQAKIVITISTHSERTVLIFSTFKKILIWWHYPFKRRWSMKTTCPCSLWDSLWKNVNVAAPKMVSLKPPVAALSLSPLCLSLASPQYRRVFPAD